MQRHFLKLRTAIAVVLVSALSAGEGRATTTDPTIDVDWSSKTGGCFGKLTGFARYKVVVHDINDVALTNGFLPAYTFSIRVTATPVSGPIQNAGPLVNASSATSPGLTVCPATRANDLANERQRILNSPAINPLNATGSRIELAASLAAANAEASAIQSLLSAAAICGDSSDPLFLWWQNIVSGPHTFTGYVNLQPNMDYKFHLLQTFVGKVVDSLNWRCGENDVVTLSIGTLFSSLPTRTYIHQKALVPAGSTNVNDILVVNGDSHENILGTALINVHMPAPERMPDWFGWAISSGLVYRFGDTPNASALGYFGGLSFHLYRSLFITPGIHVGQFADFPPGFAPGTVIPDQFGDLTPRTRTTAHFGFALTYRTNSFKKTQTGSGQASTKDPAQ
jgi:hypothetical protein